MTDAGADSGVLGGRILTAFVAAVMARDGEVPRREVRDAVGDAGFVDACGVLANFNMMTRIADATGIPIDDGMNMATTEMRQRLGIESFASAENSRSPTGARLFVGRLLAPIVPKAMSVLARLRR